MSELQQASAATIATEQSALDAALSLTEQKSIALAQMKMEGETIMTECRARPRDFVKIKQELKQQLEAFPELAELAIYCKPVGKDPDTKQMRYARGLSIRSAELLAEVYRYNRVRCDVTIEGNGDRVKIEAVFVDFQNCRTWQDAGYVSAFYKSRNGQMIRIPEDRFFDVVVKAAASKRVREVILRSINAALKAWFENECIKIQQLRCTPEEIQKVVAAFRDTFGVGLEKLEYVVGKPRKMGWMPQDVQLLRGIFAALKDGETTVDQAFNPKDPVARERAGDKLPDAAKKAAEDLAKLQEPPKPAPVDAAKRGRKPKPAADDGSDDEAFEKSGTVAGDLFPEGDE